MHNIKTPILVCSILIAAFQTRGQINNGRNNPQINIERILPMQTFNTSNFKENILVQKSLVSKYGKGEVSATELVNIRHVDEARKQLNLDDIFVRSDRDGEKMLAKHFTFSSVRNRSVIDKNVLSKITYSPVQAEGVIGIITTPIQLVDVSKSPVPLAGWKAFDSPGDAAADVSLAVSEQSIVVTSRTSIGFFDKAGTALKSNFYTGDLFKNLVPAEFGIDSYFDTRCIYDPFRKRFWIGVLAYHNNADTSTLTNIASVFCVAVSKTQNPMDGFYTYWWPAGHDINNGADYPMMGIDKKMFLQTNTGVEYMVQNNKRVEKKRYVSTCINNADALAAGNWEEGWRFWGLTNPNNNNEVLSLIRPVIHYEESPYTFFAGIEGNNVVLFGVKNPLRPDQSLSSWAFNFDSDPFANSSPGPQKNSNRPLWYNFNSPNILSATYRNGKILLAMNDAKDWFNDGTKMCSIRLIRINTATPNFFYDINRVFGKNSSIDDQPNDKVWYGYPSLAVNKRGDMVVSYTRNGPSVFPEARYSGWRYDGKDILPGRASKKGEREYHFDALTVANGWGALPWGDCSGASVDPSDDFSFYVAATYATSNADNNWAIWVSKLKFW